MTSGRKTRLYRLIVDTWPTPDGRPFDRQPASAYAQAIDAWKDDGATRGMMFPAWMAVIDWTLHLPEYGDPLPGVWLATLAHRFTVPAHRRNHFLSPTAARKALAALQAWGAHGHIETSDPITWKGQP